jgi:hypothetical protein
LYIFLDSAVYSFTSLKTKGKNTHRGEVLKDAVRKVSFKITTLTKRMSISRGTYYNHIEDPELSFELLERYGKILKYDFTADFPEMQKYALEESIETYGPPSTFEEAVNQMAYYKEKYYQLLEKYTHLMEEKKKESNGNR